MGSKGSARERFAIILICFGYLIFGSTMAVVSRARRFDYTDPAVVMIIMTELALGLAAILLLRRRGWTAADVGFHVSVRSTFAALGLVVGTYILYWILFVALASTGVLAGWTSVAVRFAASPALVLFFLLLNSVFEELFVVGYLIEATPANEGAFAVSVSALVRLLYHTYQGPVALASILPLGVIFAMVYLRWRNLWPLFVAHTIVNLAAWAWT